MLLVSFSAGRCQTIVASAGMRHEIRVLTDSIAKEGILFSDAVGIIGAKTKQWQRFEQLKKSAKTEELTKLTDDSRPVVRCYAFLALTERRKVNIFPTLLKHLYDTAKLTTFYGCIVDSRMAGDYFLDVVTPGYIDKTGYKLTKQQSAVLDSILLADPKIKLAAKSHLLQQHQKK